MRIDDWYWLRDRDDPAVLAHLEAENAYTAAAMAPTGTLQEALYAEMVARIQETDLSVPVRKGPWRYYSRSVEGSSYGIHCRRPADGPDDAEQVLLDENALAEGHDYFSLGNFAVSPDHRWLVYSTDTTGGERYTMRFRDLGSGAESGRVDRGHLVRVGVGQRQRHRLLRPGGRGHAPLPALAPPGRGPTRPTTCWSSRSPTTTSTSAWAARRTTGTSCAGSTRR